jgi:peptidyl-dipeptidase Dcp
MNRNLIIAIFLFLGGCVVMLKSPVPSETASAPAMNPFFSESTLPYHAPPFDKIKDSDYVPAIEEGMKNQLAEIETIANSTEDPTLANTFEAMERSGALLTRVTKVFLNLTNANTSEALQKIKI